MSRHRRDYDAIHPSDSALEKGERGLGTNTGAAGPLADRRASELPRNGTEEGSRTLITHRPDSPQHKVRTIVGFSGGTRNSIIPSTTPFLIFRNQALIQFVCNADIQLFRGEHLTYEIPACTKVEVFNYTNEGLALRPRFERPEAREIIDLLPVTPVTGPAVIYTPEMIPPDLGADDPSFGILDASILAGVGGTYQIQQRIFGDATRWISLNTPTSVISGVQRIPSIPSEDIKYGVPMRICFTTPGPLDSFQIDKLNWHWSAKERCGLSAVRLPNSDAAITYYSSGRPPTLSATL